MIINVFCGSAAGKRPAYLSRAKETGRVLAEAGIDIVYGGSNVGLMGAVADSALAAGGRVIGVITKGLLERGLAHQGLTQLAVVDTMHQRKAKMSDLSDAFIALPGGAGTLEEILEQWTWGQLGIHEKPCGFLDVDHYFAPLQAMNEKMVQEGFMDANYTRMLQFSDNIATLLACLKTYQPPKRKWS